jgi:hypothetical protein
MKIGRNKKEIFKLKFMSITKKQKPMGKKRPVKKRILSLVSISFR